MAKIAMTFADQPDGLVDIKLYFDEIVEGAPPTPAQKLAAAMLQSAKGEAGVTDTETKH